MIAELRPIADLDQEETLCTAEIVECSCPEACERDHDND